MKIQNRWETDCLKKIQSLSSLKRILIMFSAIPVVVLSMCFARLVENLLCKVGLSLLCIVAGYVFWLLLLSFIPKNVFKIVAALILVIIPAAVVLNVFGDFSYSSHSYISDMKLLSTVTAPCGDYSAEAYLVSRNEDGGFHGKIYLAYLPTGKMYMYQDTKKVLYENNKMERLDLRWQDDKTLLINGIKVEVYP